MATAARNTSEAGQSSAVNAVSRGRYQAAISRSEKGMTIPRSRERPGMQVRIHPASLHAIEFAPSSGLRWMRYCSPIANRYAFRSWTNASLGRGLGREGDMDQSGFARGFHHVNDRLMRRVGIGVDD